MSTDTIPTPTKPPKRKLLDGVPHWVLVLVAIFAIGGISTAIASTQHKSNTPVTPANSVELCSMLRDPSNDILEASDFRRLAGWNQVQLVRYVNQRCPDMLSRI